MSIEVRSNEKAAPPAEVTKQTEAVEAVPQKEATQSAPEAKAPEQKAATESGAEEVVAKEESESEDGESEKETQSKDGDDPDKPKKKSGFQRRIDKLNSKITASEQERDYWKDQALKSAGESKPQSKPDAGKPVATDGKPLPTAFETHADYVEALTEWKTDQKLKERDQRIERTKVEAEQASRVQTYMDRHKSFAAKTPDFEETLADVDDIPISPAVRELLITSENGPELAYELAKNRGEYARICKLPPLAAARELGKVEAKLPQSTTEEEINKVTKAPKPVSPVGTGGKGSAQKSIFDPSISQADYERLRREQIKQRRQAG